MVRPLASRPSGRMEGEPQEHEALNIRDWQKRLGLRSHSSPKGPPPGKQGQVASKFRSGSSGGAHGRMSDPRRIGPATAPLHIGKLIAQGRDSSLSKASCTRFHAFVRHPYPGAMCEEKERL